MFLMSLISSKKRTKEFDFTTMTPQVDLFSFVFWRKLNTPKNHFEIIWPLTPIVLQVIWTQKSQRLDINTDLIPNIQILTYNVLVLILCLSYFIPIVKMIHLCTTKWCTFKTKRCTIFFGKYMVTAVIVSGLVGIYKLLWFLKVCLKVEKLCFDTWHHKASWYSKFIETVQLNLNSQPLAK